MPRPTVLLIEEDAFFSQIIKHALEQRDLEVLWSSNGEEGVREAMTSKPTIIILAVMIPKKNGFQVLEELKGHPETREIPVIMLTRMSLREDIDRCLSSGACEYLIKTHHSPADIVRRVERILNLTRPEK